MAYTTIDDPSEYFQTLLYSGNASNNRALTNDGNSDLQPDWVWIKERSSTSAHKIFDSTRGVGKSLSSNSSDGEESYPFLSSFDSDGFTIGTSDGSTNASGDTYVAWQWKANGGTTTTNDASSTGVGTIDSVYQANTTAGFSIVTYTGTGSEGTIAHGLGATPKLIIWKRRTDNGNNWSTQGKISGIDTDRVELTLNSTGAKSSVDSRIGRQSQWSSTVFEVNTYVDQNASSKDYVAYCFTDIKGYSKIGSFTGNGNADGPFVYTGFKPAWVLIKITNTTNNWILFDNKRSNVSGANVNGNMLRPNLSDAELTDDDLDFTSNGFKFRRSTAGFNGDGNSYIYMAFAEHPFVSSQGVPVTAR